jgi:hypothetical protein
MLPSQKVKVPDFSLCNKGTSAKFLNMTTKACFAKTLDKLDFIKIKNFCSSKDPNKRMKMQPKAGKKIFIIQISNERFIDRTHFFKNL